MTWPDGSAEIAPTLTKGISFVVPRHNRLEPVPLFFCGRFLIFWFFAFALRDDLPTRLDGPDALAGDGADFFFLIKLGLSTLHATLNCGELLWFPFCNNPSIC